MADEAKTTQDVLRVVRLRPGEDAITFSTRQTADGWVVKATMKMPIPANVEVLPDGK